MKQGWVWDLDDFPVNQIGHPYQGNNYFTSGRANGLSFYESSAVAAFGSGTWEYFGETNLPSLNDFINTTLGGIALGEMFHRAAWLVRDTRATGRGRMWREIGATAFDPVAGFNSFTRGDGGARHRQAGRHGAVGAAGFTVGRARSGAVREQLVRRRGPGVSRGGPACTAIRGAGTAGRRMTPSGCGCGSAAAPLQRGTRARPAARRTVGGEKPHFSVMQTYDYQNNDAYATGSQSFDAALGFTQPLSSRTGCLVHGMGRPDRARRDRFAAARHHRGPGPEEPEDGDEQGVSEGPRFYDYGPGANFGVIAHLTHDRRIFAALFYEGRHIYSLDGVRANHFLQRARLDLMLPVRGSFGFGMSARVLLPP